MSRDSKSSTLLLPYRPPYDWPGLLAFLKARALKGVECVTGDFYARSVQIGVHQGWIRVAKSDGDALLLEFSENLTPVVSTVKARVRDLFDLEADPHLIAAHLAKDTVIGARVRSNPGLRVPGAFHGFELGLRAILGQQVTVKAATTIAGRLATAFGEPIATPFSEINRLTPKPEHLLALAVDDLARLGIVASRCKCILAFSRAHLSGEVCLENRNGCDPESLVARLAELPGIGPWTAHYIAMRALRWPDAFPKGDIAVRNKLGGISAKQAEQLSSAWRPWRSYAVLHIWRK